MKLPCLPLNDVTGLRISEGIAKDTFEGMLETLSRMKESIGRALRDAIDCAKYSLVVEVSLISVIFQYGKHTTHFIFAYYGFLTFGKLMMKIFKDQSEE